MVRVFDEPAAQAIEKALQPHPTQVQDWLAQADFREWRQLIQSRPADDRRRTSSGGSFRLPGGT